MCLRLVFSGILYERYHPIHESNDLLDFDVHSLDFCILILLEYAALLLIEFSVQDSSHISLSLILQFMIDLEERRTLSVCCQQIAS